MKEEWRRRRLRCGFGRFGDLDVIEASARERRLLLQLFEISRHEARIDGCTRNGHAAR
jgi:hypothetical protein